MDHIKGTTIHPHIGTIKTFQQNEKNKNKNHNTK